MRQHDVVIIGGGPAGSSCAKALVDEGIDVLVVERHKLPRYKCCSGVLFGQTQTLLDQYFGGMPPEEVYCEEPLVINAHDVREWDPACGYRRFFWEIDKDGKAFGEDYVNIWRNKFDLWLLEQSGADYLDHCALDTFAVEADRVVVKVRKKESTGAPGTDLQLACRYLVGADGGMSKVREALDPSWASDGAKADVAVYQGYYAIENMGSLKNDGWTVLFEPRIGEMLTCIHRKDDQLLLCVGGFKGRNLHDSLDALEAYLADHFGVAVGARERTEGCNLRMAPPYLGRERVILAGEAAGHMYLNGEGISAAMDSGYRAGKAIAGGLKTGGEVLDRYAAAVADIHGHIARCMDQIHFLAV